MFKTRLQFGVANVIVSGHARLRELKSKISNARCVQDRCQCIIRRTDERRLEVMRTRLFSVKRWTPVLVLMLITAWPSGAFAGTISGRLSGPTVHVIKNGLTNPGGMTVNGNDVWVTNGAQTTGGFVEEINATTGGILKVLTSSKYGFDGPDSDVVCGGNVWVANGGNPQFKHSGTSLTEINSLTGQLMRIVEGIKYQFDSPISVTCNNNNVWVANQYGATVTEVSAANGSLVRVLTGKKDGFTRADAVNSDANKIWIAGSNVTEVNARTGGVIRHLDAKSYGFNLAFSIVTDGKFVWVANLAMGSLGSVTQINESTGALVKVISGAKYGFSEPDGIALDGAHVWVANYGYGHGGVTELSETTGQLVSVFSEKHYPIRAPSQVAIVNGNAWIANSGGGITIFHN